MSFLKQGFFWWKPASSLIYFNILNAKSLFARCIHNIIIRKERVCFFHEQMLRMCPEDICLN